MKKDILRLACAALLAAVLWTPARAVCGQDSGECGWNPAACGQDSAADVRDSLACGWMCSGDIRTDGRETGWSFPGFIRTYSGNWMWMQPEAFRMNGNVPEWSAEDSEQQEITAPENQTAPEDLTMPEKPETSENPARPETPTTPEKPETPTTPEPVDPAAQGSAALSAYEMEVVRLVNEIRAGYGLGVLAADADLSRVAREKSRDMREKGYFSHNSPTYGTPFDMMKSFGISYRTAGENIAYGYSTPQAVMDGWMNSEGHRANILNASYTRIGVGYVADGNYWTQMFAG